MSIKTWWKRLFSPPESITIYTVEASTSQKRRDDHPFEKHRIRTLIASGVTLNGDLSSDVGLIIDGTIKGKVEVTGDSAALIVRAGCVEGAISGPIVIVRGTVVGDITAHLVHLYPGSRVEGVIAAERLKIDDGAEMNSPRVGAGAWLSPGLQHLPSPAPALTDDTPRLLEAGDALPHHASVPPPPTVEIAPVPQEASHPLGWNIESFVSAAARLPAKKHGNANTTRRAKRGRPHVPDMGEVEAIPASTLRVAAQRSHSEHVPDMGEAKAVPALALRVGCANVRTVPDMSKSLYGTGVNSEAGAERARHGQEATVTVLDTQWANAPTRRRAGVNGQSAALAVASG